MSCPENNPTSVRNVKGFSLRLSCSLAMAAYVLWLYGQSISWVWFMHEIWPKLQAFWGV